MRTTMDIPEPLYRQLKSKAALLGCSVKELILRGVEAELNGMASRKGKGRIALPVIRSRRPARLKLSNKEINEILFP
jgi:hypothetical protein